MEAANGPAPDGGSLARLAGSLRGRAATRRPALQTRPLRSHVERTQQRVRMWVVEFLVHATSPTHHLALSIFHRRPAMIEELLACIADCGSIRRHSRHMTANRLQQIT